MRVHVVDRPRIEFDEHVRGPEMRRHGGMPGLPALEPRHRVGLLRRPADLDERLRRHAPLRRLDARRLVERPRVVRGPGRVAQALGFVTRGQLEQAVQPADGLIDAFRRIAIAGESIRDRPDRPGGGVHLGDLVPPQRQGGPGIRSRADRVRGGHRPVLRVLVVVEEHAVALLLPPLARRKVGDALFHVAGEGQGSPADLRERPAGLDPHVDVDAPAAGRLRPADEPGIGQRLADREGHPPDIVPGDAGDRVEVDAKLVGVVEVGGPDGVRVEVDAAEVDDPGERGGILDHDLVGGSPGRERQLDRPDPVRPLVGRPLLEEELAIGAVREALQGHRPSAGAAQRAVGDGDVVADEVELGDRPPGSLRKEHLVRVRDRDRAPGDLDDLAASRHARRIRNAPAASTPRRPGRAREYCAPAGRVELGRARSSPG